MEAKALCSTKNRGVPYAELVQGNFKTKITFKYKYNLVGRIFYKKSAKDSQVWDEGHIVTARSIDLNNDTKLPPTQDDLVVRWHEKEKKEEEEVDEDGVQENVKISDLYITDQFVEEIYTSEAIKWLQNNGWDESRLPPSLVKKTDGVEDKDAPAAKRSKPSKARKSNKKAVKAAPAAAADPSEPGPSSWPAADEDDDVSMEGTGLPTAKLPTAKRGKQAAGPAAGGKRSTKAAAGAAASQPSARDAKKGATGAAAPRRRNTAAESAAEGAQRGKRAVQEGQVSPVGFGQQTEADGSVKKATAGPEDDAMDVDSDFQSPARPPPALCGGFRAPQDKRGKAARPGATGKVAQTAGGAHAAGSQCSPILLDDTDDDDHDDMQLVEESFGGSSKENRGDESNVVVQRVNAPRSVIPVMKARQKQAKAKEDPLAAYRYPAQEADGGDTEATVTVEGKQLPRSQVIKHGDLYLSYWENRNWEDTEYTVDACFAHRGTGKKREYLIKWKGFELWPEDWNKESDVRSSKAVVQYKAANGLK